MRSYRNLLAFVEFRSNAMFKGTVATGIASKNSFRSSLFLTFSMTNFESALTIFLPVIFSVSQFDNFGMIKKCGLKLFEKANKRKG